MLRITRKPATTAQLPTTLMLEGKLVVSAVSELSRACERGLAEGGPVSVDLSGVTFIDEAGIALMRRFMERRVQVSGGSSYVRALLERKTEPRTAPSEPELRRSTDPQERALLARLRSGEESAHEELIRQEGPALLALAQRLLDSKTGAAMAVQEAFEIAFGTLNRLDASASIRAWLQRLTVRMALKRLRSENAAAPRSIKPLLPRFAADGRRTDLTPWSESIASRLRSEAGRVELRRFIAQFPPEHRVVYLLREVDKQGAEEVATQIGIGVWECERLLREARMAIAEWAGRSLQRVS